MKKRTSYIFFFYIFILAVLFFAHPHKDYSEREKRYLSEFPELSAESITSGKAQSAFEEWYADRFPFRDFWVGLNAYTKLAEGRNAQGEFYHAKEGYLIGAPKTQSLAQFEKNLANIDKFAATAGLPASLLMIPSPGAFHEDLLPAGHGDYQNDRLYELAGKTLQAVSLIDPRAALSSAEEEEPVFYRTDHHLTEWGCHAAYSAWREARRLSAPPPESFRISPYPGFYGTAWSGSGYWLTEPDVIELWDGGGKLKVTIEDGGERPVVSDSLFFREHRDELDKYPVYIDGNHALTTIENPDAAGGTLLVVKDSYAHGFTPFLAKDFKTVYLLDLRYYRGSVSGFIKEKGVEELLCLYGADTLLTDSNSAWLM